MSSSEGKLIVRTSDGDGDGDEVVTSRIRDLMARELRWKTPSASNVNLVKYKQTGLFIEMKLPE